MLNATNLAQAILDATYLKTSAAEALQAEGEAVADYIMNNAEFAFSWEAVNAVPEPDPVTTATGEFVSLSISLTPSNATTKAAADTHLISEYVAGMSGATYNITDSGFSTTAGSMSTAPTVSSLTLTVNATTRENAALQKATQIINWIKALKPAGVCSGARSGYTGEGSVGSIS